MAKRYFFVTIDTEEDCWDRYHPTNNPVENIKMIPKLQALFDEYGAKPTYLINYPVVHNSEARNILGGIHKTGRCEIGMHIHPWNTPPFEKGISDLIRTKDTLMCHLGPEIQRAKLETLFNAVSAFLGYPPKSFRCGRWAFSNATAAIVSDLGIEIDTSIVPYYNWQLNLNGLGPDFSEARHIIYRFDPNDLFLHKTNGKLLEIPPTVGYLQQYAHRRYSIRRWLLEGQLKKFHIAGILHTLNLLNFNWLSPEHSTGNEMVRLAKTMLESGHNFLNMTLHSTSLLPGKSPFVRNDGDVVLFLNKIQHLLDFAKRNSFVFSVLSDNIHVASA